MSFKKLGVLLSLALCAAAPVAAQEYTLDMANEYNPTSIVGLADAHFAELVNQKTNGRVKIVVHFSGSLGIKSEDVIDSVGTGAVSLAHFPLEVGAGHNPLYLMTNLPLFDIGLKEAIAMQDVAKPFLTKTMEANGIVPLYMSIWPPIGLWSNKEIRTPEDLKGLRVRVTHPITAALFRGAGAAPAQLSWADVVPQLMTGNLDAVHTSIQGVTLGLPPASVPNFLDFGSHVSQNAAVINANLLNEFPPEIRSAVIEAGKETEVWARLEIEKVLVKERENLAAKNIKITTGGDIPRPLIDFLKDVAKPLIADWEKRAGVEGTAFLQAYQEKMKAVK